MADPVLDTSFLILLGDGATPTEDFAHPCGANARSVTFTNNTGEDTVLDCTDPDSEHAAIVRWIESQDTQLNLAGRVAKTSFPAFRAWADGSDNGGVKNIRIQIMNTAADAGGYWIVPAICQTLELGREGKATTTFSATIVGAGRRTWVPAE